MSLTSDVRWALHNFHYLLLAIMVILDWNLIWILEFKVQYSFISPQYIDWKKGKLTIKTFQDSMYYGIELCWLKKVNYRLNNKYTTKYLI